MIFGVSQKNSAAATHRRRSMATTSAVTEYEADLTSRDRMRQKDAIKRVISGKVRGDWEWKWPTEVGTPSTPIVNLSSESLDDQDWVERDEWISELSEEEDEMNARIVGTSTMHEPNKNPFRFDSPDVVGETLQKTALDRKARRRRRLHEEMLTNEGLRCFTHRRNAWTGARHVRMHSNVPSSPPTTDGTRSRSLSKAATPTSSSTTTPESGSFSAPLASQCEEEDEWADVMTEIPIAAPILPPETPMRRGINERTYATIYDKVILQSQTPFCPINLGVITKSCVEGWKRDGEWPPKGTDVAPVMASVSRMGLGAGYMSTGNRGLDAKGSVGVGLNGSTIGNGKGVIRRGLQKVMGAVRERAGSKGKEEEMTAGRPVEG